MKLDCPKYEKEKNYIIENFGYIFNNNLFSNKGTKRITKTNDFKIWFFWWQGLENSPFIVRKCYERLIKCASNFDVILLDARNYNQYIELPKYIIDRFNKKIISIQHFSDILRVSLLYTYGGLWSDATIFYTDLFSNHNEIIDKDFFSLGTFVTYLQGTALINNPLYMMMQQVFFEYLKFNETFNVYLLQDVVFRCIYENNYYVKKMIDNCKNNLHLYRSYFWKHKDNIVDEFEFNKVLKNCFASKFTYKDALPKSKYATINVLFNYDLFSKDNIVVIGNQIPQRFINYFTSRIDIVFYKYKKQLDITVDDDDAQISFPQWLNNINNSGVSIHSNSGKISINFKILEECNVKVMFLSKDVRDDKGNIIKYTIQYTEIKFCDKDVIDEPVSAWHNEPYVYIKKLCAGNYNINASFLPVFI